MVSRTAVQCQRPGAISCTTAAYSEGKKLTVSTIAVLGTGAHARKDAALVLEAAKRAGVEAPAVLGVKGVGNRADPLHSRQWLEDRVGRRRHDHGFAGADEEQRRIRRELGRRGFSEFADFSSGPATALRATKR